MTISITNITFYRDAAIGRARPVLDVENVRVNISK